MPLRSNGIDGRDKSPGPMVSGKMVAFEARSGVYTLQSGIIGVVTMRIFRPRPNAALLKLSLV